MTTKEQPPPPAIKLVKLNTGFKLAEKWVNEMTGDAEEEERVKEVEGRLPRVGLGAKTPLKSQVFRLSSDPVERKLQQKLGIGRRKPAAGRESSPPVRSEVDGDSDDDENLESRTNAFDKKRPAPALVTSTPQAKKKQK